MCSIAFSTKVSKELQFMNIHRVQKKTPPFVLQYVSNVPKPIQMKFITVIALKL